MIVKITDDAMIAILSIINHGDKAIVQRKGTGVIVMEEKRKIKYSNAPPSGRC